jgi:autotransporter-associated beta strand protein
MKIGAFIRASAFVTTCVVLAGEPARADTLTWDSGDLPVNGNWSAPTNWVGDVAPVAGDSLIFAIPVAGGTRTTVNDLTVDTLIAGITVNAAAFVLGGNEIYLGGNVTQNVNNASSGATGGNLAMVLQQGTEFVINSLGAGAYRWDQAAVISGSFGLTKSGNGTLRLNTATHTYSGDTIINAGTIELVTGHLPSGAGKGNVIVNSGGGLLINNLTTGINGLYGTGVVSKTGSNTRTLTVGNGDANGDFAGTITMTGGNSGITKTGAGTQKFSGTITSPGGITISAGTVLMNGTHSGLSGANGYSVSGTLGGTGTVSMAGSTGSIVVNSGGRLSPGHDVGAAGVLTLTLNAASAVNISGAATPTSSGAFVFDLASTANSDKILLTSGLLNIGSGVLELDDFSFNTLGGFGQGTYTLFDTGSAITGTLGSNLSGVVGGLNATLGISDDGQDIILTVVPEPSTLALAGLGLGLAVAVIRRRR